MSAPTALELARSEELAVRIGQAVEQLARGHTCGELFRALTSATIGLLTAISNEGGEELTLTAAVKTIEHAIEVRSWKPHRSELH